MRQELPQNPNERKIIVVGDDVFLNRAREEKAVWLKKNPAVTIVNLEDNWGGSLFEKIAYQCLWHSGRTLLQDPYDTDLYMPLEEDQISDSLLESAKKRYFVFEQVVKNLGALSLTIKEEQSRSSDVKGSVSGNYKVTAASANFDISKRLKESIKIHTEFPPEESKINIPAAVDILTRYNLDSDRELRQLIELRRGDNPISKREVAWAVCSELSGSFSLGVKLSLPGISDGGALSASLKTAKESALTVCVEFKK